MPLPLPFPWQDSSAARTGGEWWVIGAGATWAQEQPAQAREFQDARPPPWLPASAESVSLALGGLHPSQHRASFALLRYRLIPPFPQSLVMRAEEQGPGVWAPNQGDLAKPFLGLLCGSWGITCSLGLLSYLPPPARACPAPRRRPLQTPRACPAAATKEGAALEEASLPSLPPLCLLLTHAHSFQTIHSLCKKSLYPC